MFTITSLLINYIPTQEDQDLDLLLRLLDALFEPPRPRPVATETAGTHSESVARRPRQPKSRRGHGLANEFGTSLAIL